MSAPKRRRCLSTFQRFGARYATTVCWKCENINSNFLGVFIVIFLFAVYRFSHPTAFNGFAWLSALALNHLYFYIFFSHTGEFCF